MSHLHRARPRLGWILILLVLPTIGASRHAEARPAHKRALADHFGPRLAKSLNDCRTCHVPPQPGDDPLGEDKPHNRFGARLKKIRDELRNAGKKTSIPSRIDAVSDEDADADGVSNLLELLTGHNPGEPDDRPTQTEIEQGRLAVTAFRNAKPHEGWSAFDPVVKPETPNAPRPGAIRNPIDVFVAAEREARGLPHRPEAPRPTLLRRVYLDLIGLPPTPSELREFLADARPDAYEKVVDRLLRDPRHGERWARHWMDVWRYSDWAGFGAQIRDSKPHIWRWRDWIVESLNADKGYDRMVVEMLAADEAAPADQESLRATGYLVRNYKLLSREKWMQDVVDHTGQAFLGVTLGCAKCHDHMYDPILQKDYYRVRAIFEPHDVRDDRIPGSIDVAKSGLARAYDANPDVKTFLFLRGDDRNPAKEPLEPGTPEALGGKFGAIAPIVLPRESYDPNTRDYVIADDLSAAEGEVIAARAKLKPGELERTGGGELHELPEATLSARLAEAKYDALRALIAAEAHEIANTSETEAGRSAARAALSAQRVVKAWEARLGVSTARTARASAPAKQRAEADKKVGDAYKALAKAEADLAAPLSTGYAKRARPVYPRTSTGRRLAFAKWIVNRDNPLAARVAVNHMWLRHFGQAIVPSVFDFGRNGRKPSHPALLDRLALEFMDRGWSMRELHRMMATSATYRQVSTPDASALAKDPDNVYLWRFAPRRLEAEAVRDGLLYLGNSLDPTMGGPEIDYNQGLTNRRRSIYFRHAAEKQMEFLRIFDGPSVTECYERRPSILPQQALALANSDLAARQARRLARSIAAEVGAAPSSFVHSAFEHVLCRPPTPAEHSECLVYLGDASSPVNPTDWRISKDDGSPSSDPGLRKRESLVHVLFNHHEFVTIR